MKKNSFKELQQENEAKFEKANKAVKRIVSTRKDVWSMIGDIFELYIPQLFNALVNSKGISLNSRLKSGEKEN